MHPLPWHVSWWYLDGISWWHLDRILISWWYLDGILMEYWWYLDRILIVSWSHLDGNDTDHWPAARTAHLTCIPVPAFFRYGQATYSSLEPLVHTYVEDPRTSIPFSTEPTSLGSNYSRVTIGYLHALEKVWTLRLTQPWIFFGTDRWFIPRWSLWCIPTSRTCGLQTGTPGSYSVCRMCWSS